jgi:hypothetical protein
MKKKQIALPADRMFIGLCYPNVTIIRLGLRPIEPRISPSYLPAWKRTISDFDTVNRIKRIHNQKLRILCSIKDEVIMVSFDVKSLLTRIPIDFTLNVKKSD